MPQGHLVFAIFGALVELTEHKLICKVPDIIHLLSDHIANQIAAGEVIQRPASAVKELLENAIDAGATDIQLIVKDAGKELIQVIDNGKGMSPTDARMSFERHATSKISTIDDLFTIRTMGFRGEALASIAAVTQVELRTCQAGAETGTRIIIEGTEVKLQEPCNQPPGTNFMMKNLFYNVPGRRNFLKSTTTEYRHIVDEFTRVALAHPAIGFSLGKKWGGGMAAGTLKGRIMGLLGNSWEKKMVSVDETTDVVEIKGFIGKPEGATRTRGMQFFFVNNRFIRNNYLHHAIASAYEGLIEKDCFPFYVLFLTVDPRRVDVNVHPTKQEVKFEDDRLMYAYLNSAAKHALSRYNVAPSIDFTLNPSITQLPSVQRPVTDDTRKEVQNSYLYNVFSEKDQAHKIERNDSLKNWKSLYEIAKTNLEPGNGHTAPEPPAEPAYTSQASMYTDEETNAPANTTLLIHGSLLVATVRSGMLLVHVRRAQERIWYERLQENQANHNIAAQRLLFPVTCEWPPQDAVLLHEVLPALHSMGLDISPFGQNTFVIHSVPAGMASGSEQQIVEEILEQIKNESNPSVDVLNDKLLATMARRLSRDSESIVQPEAQQALIDELFACAYPDYTPDGQKVFVMIKKETLENMLG